jgi:glycosyltransferase involved in cell wall biosynthesis
MSQNLLPFDGRERHRYGASWMFLKLTLLRHGQASCMRKADGVIFLNEYARSTVMKHTGALRGRLATIPHGISLSFFRPPAEQKPLSLYTSDKPFRFLYVSIVDVYKHQWGVAAAVAGLRRRGVHVELELVGPAYSAALHRLQGIIKNLDPAGEFLRYTGPVPYSDLPVWYHRADGFIFASSCENMPNILLEAMAAGLPIACSNRGPMPGVLGDAGLYFEPEKPREMEETLLKLMEGPDLRSGFAHKAHERAKAYSWNRCADETFSFISEVHKGQEVRY